MARRKRPADETPEQGKERRLKEAISDVATRGEKVSWERRRDKMTAIIEELNPIETEILTLMAQKMALLDKVTNLRQEMVDSCVHPFDLLVVHADNSVECKFCGKRMMLQQRSNNDADV